LVHKVFMTLDSGEKILSRDGVTIDGVRFGNWIYCTFNTAREYTLQFNIAHTHYRPQSRLH
jgi:hypothetical protein